ncbi:hypothetical protein vseg_009268 [Gypsophila vaccaria]
MHYRPNTSCVVVKQGRASLDMMSGKNFFAGSCIDRYRLLFRSSLEESPLIMLFCQQGPRAICILSASGMVSNAILRQSDSAGGTLTYEGRFEIVNLCGSFTPTEREGIKYRAGGLSVSFSSPNGQVVGGCVANSRLSS